MMTAPTLRQPRRATRDTTDLLVGGVAAGLARHLGVSVLAVRVAFLVAAFVGGAGAVYYGLLWLLLPAEERFSTEAPGLAGATRQGRRAARLRQLSDAGPLVAVGAVAVGLLFVVEALLGRTVLLWSLVLGVVGVALLWRQADEAQRERWQHPSRGVGPLRAVLGPGGWASYARLGAGVGLLALALGVFAGASGDLPLGQDVAWVTALAVVGLAVTVGPWVVRLTADLSDERAERVRTQERADMAAHLHDSVLQTLALIQKNSDDRSTVLRLARAQERDLRQWLFEEPGSGGAAESTTLAGALRRVAAEIEDEYGAVVEVVTVGDTEEGSEDAPVRPLVDAAREALGNAARHAGTGHADVYAEVTPTACEVFVRDRGRGFDTAAVPADRHGVRHSILDRVRRHGGTAEVRSTPGEGTEVRLWVPRTGATPPAPAPDAPAAGGETS